MANQPEASSWEAGIYQLETTDPVQGGIGGVSNQPLLQLANRTRYLYDERTVTNNNVSANTAAISSLQTTSNTILDRWPIHKRHAILDGCVNSAGVPNALKILGAATREVGLNDTSIDNLSGTGPLWVAFSDGYVAGTRITGAQDYIKKIGTSVLGSGNFSLSLPTGDKTWMVFLKINTTTEFVELDYCETPYNGGYFVQAYEPTNAEVVVTRALWFNPFTQKHKFTTNSGVSWTDICMVQLGYATVASGVVSAASSFPYQSSLYDFDTPEATVIWSASQDTPMGGYLYCDGTAVSRSRFARLFAKIGTAYGVGDGSTTFNLPDMRGYFIRGFDDGAGVDTGRVFGSTQADELESHSHDIVGLGNSTTAGTTTVQLVANTTGDSGTATTQVEGGTETRPKNVAMKAWIKY